MVRKKTTKQTHSLFALILQNVGGYVIIFNLCKILSSITLHHQYLYRNVTKGSEI